MLSKSPTKSCELDPAPTWLLKWFAAEMASAQTQLINMSLETGMVPKNFKQALVRPLLKKNNLNADDLKNYRPVSNLSFVSKQLERVATRLSEHLSENNLCEALHACSRPTSLTTVPKQPFSVWAMISCGQWTMWKWAFWFYLTFRRRLTPWTILFSFNVFRMRRGLQVQRYHGSGPISRTDVSRSSSRARYLQNSSCALACHKDQS